MADLGGREAERLNELKIAHCTSHVVIELCEDIVRHLAKAKAVDRLRPLTPVELSIARGVKARKRLLQTARLARDVDHPMQRPEEELLSRDASRAVVIGHVKDLFHLILSMLFPLIRRHARAELGKVELLIGAEVGRHECGREHLYELSHALLLLNLVLLVVLGRARHQLRVDLRLVLLLVVRLAQLLVERPLGGRADEALDDAVMVDLWQLDRRGLLHRRCQWRGIPRGRNRLHRHLHLRRRRLPGRCLRCRRHISAVDQVRVLGRLGCGRRLLRCLGFFRGRLCCRGRLLRRLGFFRCCRLRGRGFCCCRLRCCRLCCCRHLSRRGFFSRLCRGRLLLGRFRRRLLLGRFCRRFLGCLRLFCGHCLSGSSLLCRLRFRRRCFCCGCLCSGSLLCSFRGLSILGWFRFLRGGGLLRRRNISRRLSRLDGLLSGRLLGRGLRLCCRLLCSSRFGRRVVRSGSILRFSVRHWEARKGSTRETPTPQNLARSR